MPDNELLDIVDEKDIVIGQDTKENKFVRELISRNVAVFVKDSEGKFIIAKRAPTKKVFPNCLDLSACGNVKAGESYQKAAEREVKEELGFSCKPKFLKKIFNEMEENGKKVKHFTGIFLCKCDSEAKLCRELVSSKKMTIKEIKNSLSKEPGLFCKFFINDFNAVQEILEKEG